MERRMRQCAMRDSRYASQRDEERTDQTHERITPSESYHETVAARRREAAERQVRDQEQLCKSILEDVAAYQEAAVGAQQRGNQDSALEYAAMLNEAEAQLQQELAKLPQRPQELSETKQRW